MGRANSPDYDPLVRIKNYHLIDCSRSVRDASLRLQDNLVEFGIIPRKLLNCPIAYAELQLPWQKFQLDGTWKTFLDLITKEVHVNIIGICCWTSTVRYSHTEFLFNVQIDLVKDTDIPHAVQLTKTVLLEILNAISISTQNLKFIETFIIGKQSDFSVPTTFDTIAEGVITVEHQLTYFAEYLNLLSTKLHEIYSK